VLAVPEASAMGMMSDTTRTSSATVCTTTIACSLPISQWMWEEGNGFLQSGCEELDCKVERRSFMDLGAQGDQGCLYAETHVSRQAIT
jgi:hypothetical protein